MASRRQVTNKLRDAYRQASKKDKGRILSEVVDTTGMGRSTARRMLTGSRLPAPGSQPDGRSLKPRGYSDEARGLLEHVWKLMGCPCGKYLKAMWPLWESLLAEAGDLESWPPSTLAEIALMSAATVDRYLAPARESTGIKGISTTRPVPALRNSISIRKAGDELDGLPGHAEADTVAHCGPALVGEFARTLTMTDMATGWTECASIRNNASRWIIGAVEELRARFPFDIRTFDSDNGGEFINHTVAKYLQNEDIRQTRSRAYQKNDQATVESKNNHVVRKNAFHWRYDTPEELALLNELWELVSLRLNFFTPTKKPIGYAETATGRRKRLYDKPATPWQRVLTSRLITDKAKEATEARIKNINPADLTRRIVNIQCKLTDLAKAKTQAMADARLLNMAQLTPSINRLATK